MTPKELTGALKRQLNPARKKWQKPDALVRALRLRRGQMVAEIGSGPGYFTPLLARAVGPSGHVFAVDPEPLVLDVLRKRVARSGVKNVTPVLGRDDDPLIPRGRCQVAVIINAYHHIPGGPACASWPTASCSRTSTSSSSGAGGEPAVNDAPPLAGRPTALRRRVRVGRFRAARGSGGRAGRPHEVGEGDHGPANPRQGEGRVPGRDGPPAPGARDPSRRDREIRALARREAREARSARAQPARRHQARRQFHQGAREP